jgi:hypothetical protein
MHQRCTEAWQLWRQGRKIPCRWEHLVLFYQTARWCFAVSFNHMTQQDIRGELNLQQHRWQHLKSDRRFSIRGTGTAWNCEESLQCGDVHTKFNENRASGSEDITRRNTGKRTDTNTDRRMRMTWISSSYDLQAKRIWEVSWSLKGGNKCRAL